MILMNLVYIYGPPGVGKYTVSKELSKITGYRLFHNQLSIEFVNSVFEFGNPSFNRLVLGFRAEVIEEAARRNVSLIFTSAYARGLNDRIIKDIIRRVKRHNGRVHFVQLYCKRSELLRRVKNKSRKGLKIRSSKQLEILLNKYNHVSSIPFVKSFFVDNTHVSPKDAARMIANHYKLAVKDRPKSRRRAK